MRTRRLVGRKSYLQKNSYEERHFFWVHDAALVNDDGYRLMSANIAHYFTDLRARPGHRSHWPYMKILYNVWDAMECEIFCPGYLSDLKVFWQQSYICMIVGEIGYRFFFFSYHLSHNESNFLVALVVTCIFLNEINNSFIRSYCGVFNSTWENNWMRMFLSKIG